MSIGGVRVSETGQGRFQAEVQTGAHRLLADEPLEVGGTDTGPSPYDLLSAALGACTVMTARLYAERKGWPLLRTQVEVRHHSGEGPPRDRFVREVAFEGPLSPDQIARLFDIVERCPVHQTLTQGARVETRPMAAEDAKACQDHFQAMEQVCSD